MSEIELDPELLSDFIVESKELLDDLTSSIIQLEDNPTDDAAIAAIFRAAHTLKGSSAFFNLVHVKNFAHKLENLLDEIRTHKRQVNPETISLLVSGSNHLKEMFGRLSGGSYDTEYNADENEYLNQLQDFLKQQPTLQCDFPDLFFQLKSILHDSEKSNEPAEKIVHRILSLVQKAELAASQATSPAETKGPPGVNSTFFFSNVDFSSQINRALFLLTQAEADGNLDEIEYGLALDEIKKLINDNSLVSLQSIIDSALEDFLALKESGIGFDPLLTKMMGDKLEPLLAQMEQKEDTPSPNGLSEVKEAPKKENLSSSEEKLERKTMRIDEEKVDGFMNYVGELIVTAETFNYLQKMVEVENVNPVTLRAFKNANQAFRELSDELQVSLMEIRRVPIKGLLQKINMMARDLSRRMDKKIRIQLDGQDVALDKSIAESLEGPLVHVVRNSLDHGLEKPDVRLEKNKPEEGALLVRASSDKDFFYLEVADDGRGIDPAKIKKSALEKGVLTDFQAHQLSDKEIIDLVFHPGFSTATEITDVSGRGVGMDVVRTNIQALNGIISIDSRVNQGTTIKLKIPLSVTLQVAKALLVRIGNGNFIISLENVLESLRPSAEELTTIEGRGEALIRRGQILPLIRLYRVFGIEAECMDPTLAILVVVETPTGRYGLMVDEVLGQQQVVVKELSPQFKKLKFLAGSATLGDGRLGLVLDTEGVVRLAHNANN